MQLLIVHLLLLLQGASFIPWMIMIVHVKGDLLPPGTLGTGICNNMVCGRGACKVSESSRFGFECDCDPGWNRFWSDDQFAFLPCLIPQCVYDSVCYNDSIAQTAFPAIPHSSPFDPCFWSFCGEGTCIKVSDFEHRCECKEGFTNLLDMPNLPCFKDCKVRADCLLGFTISNNTTPSPPYHLEQSNNAIVPKSKSQWIYTWIILLVVLQQQIMYS